MTRARFVLLAAAALALVLAGCGGSRLSKTEYEQKLKTAGRELTDASTKLARANDAKEYISGVEQVQTTMRKVADDLDGLTPPKDVAAANDRLVDALRALADGFDEVKEAAREGAQKAREAGARLAGSKPAADVQQAVIYLQRLGYDVGLLSGA